MRHRLCSRTLPIVLAAALGCTTISPQPATCPPGVSEVLASPPLLREQADAALEKDDLALAYRYLALIETLHPESDESRELFPAAAKLFKRLYFRHRISQPDSAWLNSEPVFMYQWLAAFFRDADAFPEEPVATLFVGMPFTFYEGFAAYAKTHPVLSRWQLRAREDNGRIEGVSGQPAGAGVTAGGR